MACIPKNLVVPWGPPALKKARETPLVKHRSYVFGMVGKRCVACGSCGLLKLWTDKRFRKKVANLMNPQITGQLSFQHHVFLFREASEIRKID